MVANKVIDKINTLFPDKERKILLSIVIVVIVLNFLRLFTNCFWGDEAFSINLANNNIIDSIIITASDVHPPFHPIILSLFHSIFGSAPFVYHFVSFIPYVLILIISLTYVYKKYGFTTSVLIVLFSSFLSSSLFYMVEVRMYEWGLFFVFCSFLLLREVLESPNNKNTILFVLSSVLAAYTHYYCLLAVSFFYLILIVNTFFKKDKIKNTMIIVVVSIVAYLPWISITIASIRKVSKNFWIETIPSFKECIAIMFESDKSILLFIILLCLLAVFLSFKYKNIHNIKIDVETTWLIAGLLSIVGSIVVATIISNAVRPILLTRYLYPVSIIAWVIFGYLLSKCDKKKTISCVIVVLIAFIGMSNFFYTYNADMDADRSTDKILSSSSEINSEDIIYTNMAHMNNTMIDYYYPNTTHYYCNNVPQLGERNTYWLFVDYGPSDWLTSEINKQGYNIELKIHDKFASYMEPNQSGFYDMYVYKITKK